MIESHMETGRGAVVSMLVEHGILKPGTFLVAGSTYAKIRTLQDYAGKPLQEAGPATPATVTGFKEIPQFGDRFVAVANEKAARVLSGQHQTEAKQDVQSSAITSTDLLQLMNRRAEKQLVNVIVRADVQGSLTSVADSLKLLENQEVAPRIISSGVGSISENDVRMAQSSEAIIYGFNVQLPPAVKRLAQREKVPVRLYKIIYELIDDAKRRSKTCSPLKLLKPRLVNLS